MMSLGSYGETNDPLVQGPRKKGETNDHRDQEKSVDIAEVNMSEFYCIRLI